MTIQITEQDDEPRIENTGELVYSEKSENLFIRTKRNGIRTIGGVSSIIETDPLFSSWLVSSPNISLFTNDVGYLTSFSETDPVFNAWLLATPPLYSFTETDPVYTSSSWYTTTNNASSWDTAYGWGNHASAGYLTSQISHADVLVDGDFTSQGIMLRGASSGTYSILTDNSTNWNTAYSWGNHSSAGYFPISGGALTGKIVENVVPLIDSATISVDATLGNIFKVTLGGNRVLGNPTGAVDGQRLTFIIRQDAVGGRSLTLDTKFRFGTDLTSITLTTTINKTDYIGVIYHATDDKFDVVAFMKGY